MINDRPQDIGRQHVRRRTPAREAAALIERWRAVERDTLRRVTVELEGVDKGTGLDGSPMGREYPSTSATAGLVDLGIKLARDLGSDIDPDPQPATTSAPARRRPRKLDV